MRPFVQLNFDSLSLDRKFFPILFVYPFRLTALTRFSFFSTVSRFLQNKSFWQSITDKQKISSYNFLCSAFENAAYERALSRAIDIPTCRVIPYFKFNLDKLKIALSSSTSFSFTSGTIEDICLKVIMNFAKKKSLSEPR